MREDTAVLCLTTEKRFHLFLWVVGWERKKDVINPVCDTLDIRQITRCIIGPENKILHRTPKVKKSL